MLFFERTFEGVIVLDDLLHNFAGRPVIDINDKITETVQRRRQILNTIKTRQEDRAAREEAAEKRRKQIREESRDKFLAKTQKLAKAQARKQRIL